MEAETKISLQDQYAPNLICFGCGPANQQGLQIKSFAVSRPDQEDIVVATYTPQPHHVAFEGMVNGGIIGVLLDCHMNWTAVWHLMRANAAETPPCCVTAKFEVAFQKPTPTGKPLHLTAKVVEASKRKAVVECSIGPEDGPTATGSGTFVAVKPDHPAFHRW